MKKCPFCFDDLQVVDVTIDGYDISGCIDCDYEENEPSFDKDREYFLKYFS